MRRLAVFQSFRIVFVTGLLAAAPLCHAKRLKEAQPPAEDGIRVVGHVALPAGAASEMLAAVHWRRNFLYIEQAGRHSLVTVDVTAPAKPEVTADLALPDQPGAHISAVEGQAVLTAAFPETGNAAEARGSVHVLSFADPAHPRLVREFAKVSGLLRDNPRGLIYVVNDEGLWILQKQPAPDVELQKQYEHDVIYNH